MEVNIILPRLIRMINQNCYAIVLIKHLILSKNVYSGWIIYNFECNNISSLAASHNSNNYLQTFSTENDLDHVEKIYICVNTCYFSCLYYYTWHLSHFLCSVKIMCCPVWQPTHGIHPIYHISLQCIDWSKDCI